MRELVWRCLRRSLFALILNVWRAFGGKQLGIWELPCSCNIVDPEMKKTMETYRFWWLRNIRLKNVVPRHPENIKVDVMHEVLLIIWQMYWYFHGSLCFIPLSFFDWIKILGEKSRGCFIVWTLDKWAIGNKTPVRADFDFISCIKGS